MDIEELKHYRLISVDVSRSKTGSQYLSSFCVSPLRSMSSSRRASEAGDGVSIARTSWGEADESVSQIGGGGRLWKGLAPKLDKELDLNPNVSLGLTMALTWSPGVDAGLEAGRRAGAGTGAGLSTSSASVVASPQNWNLGG